MFEFLGGAFPHKHGSSCHSPESRRRPPVSSGLHFREDTWQHFHQPQIHKIALTINIFGQPRRVVVLAARGRYLLTRRALACNLRHNGFIVGRIDDLAVRVLAGPCGSADFGVGLESVSLAHKRTARCPLRTPYAYTHYTSMSARSSTTASRSRAARACIRSERWRSYAARITGTESRP